MVGAGEPLADLVEGGAELRAAGGTLAKDLGPGNGEDGDEEEGEPGAGGFADDPGLLAALGMALSA